MIQEFRSLSLGAREICMIPAVSSQEKVGHIPTDRVHPSELGGTNLKRL